MRGEELAVEQAPAARDQPRDEMRARDLRCVARTADHRFAAEGSPERDAVKAADEAPFVPAFDAVCMAAAHRSEERRVGTESVSTCKSRVAQHQYKKTKKRNKK